MKNHYGWESGKVVLNDTSISFIKENLMLSKHVLIHCNGGKGRSGMIAALVLKTMKEKFIYDQITYQER